LGCAFSSHVFAWLLDKVISSVAVGSFDKFYTDGTLKENPESEASMFIRYQFLGCAFSSQVVAWLLDKWISSQLLGCAFSSQVVAWLLDKVISSVAVGGSSTYVGRLLETGASCRTWGLQPKFNAKCLAEKELLLGFDKSYTDGSLKDNPELEPSMFIRCQLLGCAFSCQVVAWFLDKLFSFQLFGCAFSSQVFAWLLVKVISPEAVGGSCSYVGRLVETAVSCKTCGLQRKFGDNEDTKLFDAETQRPFPAHWLDCDNCDRKSPPSNTCRYCTINLCSRCRRAGMLCACYYRASLLQGLRPRGRRLDGSLRFA
jgi:hypothetical protein